MEKFNYLAAIKRLGEIAGKVEDPSTGLDEIDKYMKESDELIVKCREYLRAAREKMDAMD